ncbi:MAG: serine/threonine protein kinase [Burkholderiales bacterium]|nr:serine/threonine protein kinase [Burkholderiales bacterium]
MKQSGKCDSQSTLGVEQWRAVFACLDDLFDAEVAAPPSATPAGSAVAAEPARTTSRPDPADIAVDQVVRRWRESTQLDARTGCLLPRSGVGPGVLLAARQDLVLGCYRLIDRIGQGGMGSVWRARRMDGLYDAEVAIKLLGSLALSAHARDRFEQEGKILARLKHPNIAGLLDAGVSEDGQRYLVLELVDGVTISEYIRTKGSSIEARLLLFRQLLDAVSFAHGRLVIHRDIKPANVLVTAGGTVKLLDFGIARLLQQRSDADEGLTRLHGSAYTEAYAAPEQIRGESPTVACDVYSLGVVLLELLAGKRATWPGGTRKAAPGALPAELSMVFPHDLRAIIRKALEIEPEDRYRSVAAFDDDVRRYLCSEPVTAHAASRGYAARKFVRRHRTAVIAYAAVALALVAGASVATWQWRVASAQAARAEAVQEFMARMFDETDPENARGRNLTASELMDRGAKRLESELADQPAVRASLQARIAANYNALGEHQKAKQQLEPAIASFERIGAVEDAMYFEALYALLEVRVEERDYPAANVQGQKIRRLAKAAFGEPNAWLGRVLESASFAATQTGDAIAGEQLAREALAQQAAYAKGIDAISLSITSSLTEALIHQGKFREARDATAEKIARSAAVPSYSASNRLVDRYTLARMDYVLNRFDLALIELQPLVDEMTRHMGARHPRTMNARNLLAQTMHEAGFDGQAVDVQLANLRIAYHSAQSNAPEDREGAALEELVLAKLLLASDPGTAESYAARGVEFLDSRYERPTWLRERARWILSEALLLQRRLPEAEQQLNIALNNMSALPGYQTHTAYADALQARALVHTAQKRASTGREDIAVACKIFASQLPEGSLQSTRCQLYSAWIDAITTRRAPLTTVFDPVKNEMLQRVLPGHRSREALEAMIEVIERGGTPAARSANPPAKHSRPNPTDSRVPSADVASSDDSWPISLSDQPPASSSKQVAPLGVRNVLGAQFR